MARWFERVKQAEAPPARLTGYVFGAVFALSFAITAVTVWLASSAPGGEGNATGPIRNIFISLGFNFILIGGLAALVGWRVWRIFVNRNQDAGAKLHLRYISLFALAAAVPAVVVALFFGLLVNQGVDSWFSSKIKTVVDNHREVAKTLVQMQSDQLTAEISVAQKDINGYINDLRGKPSQLSDLLTQEAGARQFLWIYIVDRQGGVLAKAERPGAPPYVPPPPEKFAEVDRDPQSTSPDPFNAQDMWRIVFRLKTDPAAYAVVAAPLPAGLLDRLTASSQAVEAY